MKAGWEMREVSLRGDLIKERNSGSKKATGSLPDGDEWNGAGGGDRNMEKQQT